MGREKVWKLEYSIVIIISGHAGSGWRVCVRKLAALGPLSTAPWVDGA